jgi:hypothetical protein
MKYVKFHLSKFLDEGLDVGVGKYCGGALQELHFRIIHNSRPVKIEGIKCDDSTSK